MLLQCGAELNRQSMSGCSELPPHPQPFSSATRMISRLGFAISVMPNVSWKSSPNDLASMV